MEHIVYRISVYVDDFFVFDDTTAYSDNSFMFFALLVLFAIFVLVFRYTSRNGLPRIRDQTVIYINLFQRPLNKYVLSCPVVGCFNLLQKIRDDQTLNNISGEWQRIRDGPKVFIKTQ